MTILGICLEVRVAHKVEVLENGAPVLFVLAVRLLTRILLDRDLVAVEVLKHQVAEVGRFILLAELNFNIRLARSR